MALRIEVPPEAPLSVIEQLPFDMEQVLEAMITEPVPPAWYQVTVPVGE